MMSSPRRRGSSRYVPFLSFCRTRLRRGFAQCSADATDHARRRCWKVSSRRLWNRNWTVATRLLPQTDLRLTSRSRTPWLICAARAANRGPNGHKQSSVRSEDCSLFRYFCCQRRNRLRDNTEHVDNPQVASSGAIIGCISEVHCTLGTQIGLPHITEGTCLWKAFRNSS